jgi:ribosomal protein S27AE
MYFILLTLTVLAGLTVARWFAEPACPACAAKNWTDHPPRLECGSCGWSNLATVPVRSMEQTQYEIGFNG